MTLLTVMYVVISMFIMIRSIKYYYNDYKQHYKDEK